MAPAFSVLFSAFSLFSFQIYGIDLWLLWPIKLHCIELLINTDSPTDSPTDKDAVSFWASLCHLLFLFFPNTYWMFFCASERHMGTKAVWIMPLRHTITMPYCIFLPQWRKGVVLPTNPFILDANWHDFVIFCANISAQHYAKTFVFIQVWFLLLMIVGWSESTASLQCLQLRWYFCRRFSHLKTLKAT